MLYGCCVNLLPKTLDRIGLEYAGRLKRLGYDYIELPLNELAQLSEQEFRDARTVLEELDLPCRACNDFMPARFQITGPDVTSRAELTDYLRRALERAARLGISFAVFGSPWSRSCPEHYSREALWPDRRIPVPCGGGGRPISGGHCHRAHQPGRDQHAQPLLRRGTDGPHGGPPQCPGPVRLLPPAVRGGPPSVLLDGGSELLIHTHISQLEGRRYPTDLSLEPMLPEYAGVLRQIGYAGGVSVESKVDAPEHWEEQAALALANLRQVLG